MEPPATTAAARKSAGAIPVLSPFKKPINMEEKPTLRQVFDSEESPLLRYAYGLTGQRENAEDIVQEAFLRLHSHWSDVEIPRPWLFRCVRNLALNHLRKNKHNTPLEAAHEPESENPDPDTALSKFEAIGTLQLLISELPEPDRTLISLKYLSDLKYEEIAHQTNLTVSNVGYKLHHTLKSLAASLRHLGIETSEG